MLAKGCFEKTAKMCLSSNAFSSKLTLFSCHIFIIKRVLAILIAFSITFLGKYVTVENSKN